MWKSGDELETRWRRWLFLPSSSLFFFGCFNCVTTNITTARVHPVTFAPTPTRAFNGPGWILIATTPCQKDGPKQTPSPPPRERIKRFNIHWPLYTRIYIHITVMHPRPDTQRAESVSGNSGFFFVHRLWYGSHLHIPILASYIQYMYIY